MYVSRIGFTPLKGGRHCEHPSVELATSGPVGDRVFCLVDPARRRVLRTVENPALLQTSAVWTDGMLTTTLPGRTVAGVPAPTGEVLKVDYWGRVAALEVVDGGWAVAYSRHLGYDVVLARVTQPGEVVFGAAVSLVTTAALATLARRLGAAVDEAGFRATFTIDTGGATVLDDLVEGPGPHSSSRKVRLGAAEVQVCAAVPRCAVVDLDPRTGARASRALSTLGRYRGGRDGVTFGLDAVVSKPGRVHVGDPVHLVEGG